MATKPNCKDCIYSYPDVPKTFFQCRRHAPKEKAGDYGIFPIMHGTDFCGDFKTDESSFVDWVYQEIQRGEQEQMIKYRVVAPPTEFDQTKWGLEWSKHFEIECGNLKDAQKLKQKMMPEIQINCDTHGWRPMWNGELCVDCYTEFLSQQSARIEDE